MSRKSVLDEFDSLEKYQKLNFAGQVLQRMMQAVGVTTQSDLAVMLDVGKAAISDAKRRNMVPAEWFLKLCRSPHHANPIWLETGLGPRNLPRAAVSEAGAHSVAETPGHYGPLAENAAQKSGTTHIPLPIACYRLTHEGGLATVQEDSPESLQVALPFLFHKHWLEELGDPASMKLLRIRGDAMSPALRDGDLVVLDEAQREVFEGAIYVLGLDGQVVLKRLARRMGAMLLLSENRQLYEPLEVPYPNPALLIVGRVVWLSRKL